MKTNDSVQLAAAARLEALAREADLLAERLRGKGQFPPAAVAELLLQTDKALARLHRSQAKLDATSSEAAS